MTKQDLLGAIARGWCSERNSHKEFDSALAEDIFREIRKVLPKSIFIKKLSDTFEV